MVRASLCSPVRGDALASMALAEAAAACTWCASTGTTAAALGRLSSPAVAAVARALPAAAPATCDRLAAYHVAH